MFATTASNTLAHSTAAVRALKPHTRVALRSTAATRVQVKCTASMSAKVVVPKEITTVTPTEDRVFVKVAPEEDTTEGGIVLPLEVRKKPTSGDVVSVGPSKEVTLKPGDTVLYSKFGIGCTDMLLEGEDHILIRERDCLGIFPKSNASADDVPELKPLSNRVLIKVDVADDETSGGVLLPTAAKERPITGSIVSVGPGKFENGEVKPCKCKIGDRVFFFKYAGQELQTRAGVEYKVLHEDDVLGKL